MKKYLDMDWEEIFNQCKGNVESMWEIFKENIHQGIVKYIPSVKDFYKGKKNRWSQPLAIESRQLIQKSTGCGKSSLNPKTQRLSVNIK